MKTLIILASLALMSLPASAGTVPSTFDEHCNVNYVNGGCGGTSPATGGGGSFAGAARDICPGPDQPDHCGRCETKAQARK